MNWLVEIQNAINFIEENILEDITIDDVAHSVHASKDYFNRLFMIVSGMTIKEYIRNRRLSLAGQELRFCRSKVVEIAYKYAYETPESFSKAFLRFHGISPADAKDSKRGLKCFCPLQINIEVKGGFVMARKLIPNVQKVYENPADNYMFCSCMRSSMAALNGDQAFDFLFFAGVTGDLFLQVWNEPKWQYNDSFSTACRDSQVPIRAAFDACGYEYEYIKQEDIQKNKSQCISKIVESIDKGYPVLTFGIVGPPICSIIYGYDENGEVLIGYSQFTDEVKEDNAYDNVAAKDCFQVRNGLDRSTALVFFKKKKEQPAIKDSIKKSIENIPHLASLTPQGQTYFAKDAFDKWADSLLCDEYFQNEEMLGGALDSYGSCVVMAATNMYFIQEYLDRALKLCPEISDQINRLKEAYGKENEALQKVAEKQGGLFFDADQKVLLNKEYRVELSQLVRRVGECYADAAKVVSSSND